MKKTKPIRFRCYCFECSADDEQANDRLRSDTAEADPDGIESGEESPRPMADVIGKLLFGA